MSWHLEKSSHYDQDETWLVIVDDEIAGNVRPVRLGRARSRARRRYQAFLGAQRLGKPCRTRKEAAVRVLESYGRPANTDAGD